VTDSDVDSAAFSTVVIPVAVAVSYYTSCSALYETA
jgi:hypothetical protein